MTEKSIEKTTYKKLKEPIVAVVDEDVHVNFLIVAFLKIQRLDAYAFHSGDEFLKQLDAFAEKLDVTVINGNTAEQQGGLIISKIKEANKDVKILVVAGDDSARIQILRYGADDFVAKPLNYETIASKITALAAAKGAFAG